MYRFERQSVGKGFPQEHHGHIGDHHSRRGAGHDRKQTRIRGGQRQRGDLGLVADLSHEKDVSVAGMRPWRRRHRNLSSNLSGFKVQSAIAIMLIPTTIFEGAGLEQAAKPH